jgi:hypothetical protein
LRASGCRRYRFEAAHHALPHHHHQEGPSIVSKPDYRNEQLLGGREERLLQRVDVVLTD